VKAGSSREALHRRVGRIAEPQILFPLIAVVLLAALWMATMGVIRLKHTEAEHDAARSSLDLSATYQAQVNRAVRRIGEVLNIVIFWHQHNPTRGALSELDDRGLLLPDLLFTVSIVDRDGTVVDSTQPPVGGSVADQDSFRRQRLDPDVFLVVGHLPKGPTGDGKVIFSKRLNGPKGDFAGVVMATVDAAFFVSDYDAAKLGQHGVLAVLGTDGIVLVRRSGDTMFSGDALDFAPMIPKPDEDEAEPPLTRSSWDGVWRWSTARKIYDFPLAILVGVEQEEQLAAVQRDVRGYLLWAAAGSVGIILLMAALGRMSWQLAQGRLRESETKLEHARRVEYLAYHDGLTGLSNRSMFSKLLAQGISEARRYDRRLAVAFLDLDRFKQINDSLGHEAGDQLLVEVAARLQGCVRDSDKVARLGGDEFVVLFPEIDEGMQAAIVAQKILAVIGKPFTLIGHEFRVTASIGISLYPQDGEDEQTLTKNADIAMYQAKAEGKNNFQFYSEKLNVNSLERLALESSLRHALERNEFRLYYQAKRDIRTGRIAGMEALLRWEHPDLGTLAPLRFIPIAEDTGLIVPIGKWVLKTACLQSVAWQMEGLPPLSVAVNMTARQFSDEHLLQDLASILKDTGINPQLLEIELSESLLIHDVETTLRILAGIKSLGVRIAVDDFGTGYSSLATLQRFPLDTVKIARSFVGELVGTSESSALADAVIAMGKSMSLTVIAQGIETKEQAEFLRAHACDELQGFYFNRPLSAHEFSRLIRAQSADISYLGTRAGLLNPQP
jgi:diguanylate cyclase (GGDEF)-like protein